MLIKCIFIKNVSIFKQTPDHIKYLKNDVKVTYTFVRKLPKFVFGKFLTSFLFDDEFVILSLTNK